MGVLNKLYLRFPVRFWPHECEWLEYSGHAPASWVEFFNLGKYLGKPLLVGLSIGNRGRALEQDSDEVNVAAAMHVLRTIYGTSIPDPTAWQMTRWDSDPFAAGAYLSIPPGASSVDCDVLAEPCGERLFFAGEATQRWDYGTVHGAFWSGEHAARRLIEPASAAWIASRQSPVYHISLACVNAQEITPENRICGPAAQQGRRRHIGCPQRPKPLVLQ
jgi:monoamine oxidase